ncbi:MAG: hypothetical protein DI537_43725 [Stutzerimonas stutzeri]|nr:MAG: hypothetical protein DI537_43725 [Stutzerimonas stutzeri]
MADQNDSNDDLVGLAAIHDANEVRAVDPLDWRDVLHEHLKDAVGKSYTIDLGDRVPLFALKPSAFAPSREDAKRLFDEIMAMPGTVVVFEDGEPTIDTPTLESARAHNERLYPDLMRRIDRLANRRDDETS